MNKFACQIGLAIASLLAFSLPLYTMFWIYPHFIQIITFEKEVDAKQIANHIAKMLVLDPTNQILAREDITDHFVAMLEEAKEDFDLTKIKIFSSQGEVLYSTDVKDVGTVNTNQYFTDVVAKGKIFSKVVHTDEQTMEKETVGKDVVETYVPLMRGQHFFGAFEIYYDISYSGHNINTFIAQSRIIVLAVFLLLLLAILFISISAISFQKKLHRAEREIQRMKEQIPPLFTLSRDDNDE